MGRSYLSTDELTEYVLRLAEQPELWEKLIRHDPVERQYEQVLANDTLNVWLICWNEGHDTGFHDHDGSAGAVVVVDGTVIEERLYKTGRDALSEGGKAYKLGETFCFGPYDIHRVKHTEKAPSVTIHAYSPPLVRMGSYDFGTDEQLRRLPMSSEEELRPLEQALASVQSPSMPAGKASLWLQSPSMPAGKASLWLQPAELSGGDDYTINATQRNSAFRREMNERILAEEGAKSLRDGFSVAWDKVTSCDPDGWGPDNPAWGQCSVTALVAQDRLGGEIIRGVRENGEYHYWNRMASGKELDFTAHQFSELQTRDVQEVPRADVLEDEDILIRYGKLRTRLDATSPRS